MQINLIYDYWLYSYVVVSEYSKKANEPFSEVFQYAVHFILCIWVSLGKISDREKWQLSLFSRFK